MFDSQKIKADFPVLSRKINGNDLVYLDNSATSQKPQAVINAITEYYSNHVANVHRGVHTLSDESTNLFEQSKQKIAHFFGAEKHELIFVRNTTEAINGVAYGWGEQNVRANDVIIVTTLDHHSNIVVWQELAKRKQAQLIFVGITRAGQLDLAHLEAVLKQFSEKIKLVAFPHVSNALGTVVPVASVVELVRRANPQIRILVDGAQSAPHMPVNFAKLGVDFYAFSGHKLMGPMGIGGLLVREELLKTDEMRPWLFGGGMIAEVHESQTIFHDDLSERFVAGTPDVASAVGLAAACEYLENVGMQAVLEHDIELVNYALQELAKVENVVIVGPNFENTPNLNENVHNPDRIGSVSFLYEGVHAHDVAQVLDSQGVAVRSGHHCTMPLHTSQNWIATTRVSFQIYNSKEDIDSLVVGLQKVKEVLL
ncbi:SufS family cysteine desulfurase [Candidatus Woesebacteria bacterium]|nr:SufS family cysteine desulfurase [Candidatus Woesebacteria bacterium]